MRGPAAASASFSKKVARFRYSRHPAQATRRRDDADRRSLSQMRHEAWELDDVLDGIDGVAYAVDLRYRILAVGRTRWNEFAAGNGALELTAASVLGQNLFDIIQGDDVREVYRRYTD